jgi:hypothetical protein
MKDTQLTGDAVPPQESLAQRIECALMREFGPLIGGNDLHHALGFTSTEAFRQAEARSQMPIAVFNIPHRRGKFALVADLATWLAALRSAARSQ